MHFYEKERKVYKKKGMIGKRMLIQCYTIQQIKPNVCTNIQYPMSYEKSLTQFPCLTFV